MLSSGSSSHAVARDGRWGLLMVAGVTWLAVAWSVLRLDPIDIVHVAGPVLLFGAATEVLRALAGRPTWWLNAGMAVLFAVAGVILLLEQDSSYTTPAALIGWYLLVRGAADVVIATLTRDTDRIWGLLMVVGVLETGLGFFAASPFSRTADLVVVMVGGLGVLRAIADLATALRLREAAVRADLLHLPPEREAGVAGYSAGLSDFPTAPPRGRRRRRAATQALDTLSTPVAGAPAEGGSPAGTATAGTATAGTAAAAGGSFHDEVVRTTADLDAMLALAGVTGAGVGARAGDYEVPEVPDTPEGVEDGDDPERTTVRAAKSEDAEADKD
ncbi:HdeD family acid-resistance protein [Jidongwangia harbinensis]|uniref:HdeD family acid-resistance protein n=1 Tax=Jidongwangia harbinensis TaxID=2878561 RepID=UPI001CDA1EC5|nr:DUF308 domain-containing protein [Jidongwangia harbinensis]MCA2212325.1 DUF308 domain-containing protein [Jidongwangia harbinensis]